MSKPIITKLKIIHCPHCGESINAPLATRIRHSTHDPQGPILSLKCPTCSHEKHLQAHVLPLPIDHAIVVFSAVIQLLAVEFLNEKRIRIEPAYLDTAAPPTLNS